MEAAVFQAPLRAEVLVVSGFDELIDAWIQSVLQTRSLLRDGEGGAGDHVVVNAGLDVGKICSEFGPHVAIPFLIRVCVTSCLIVSNLIRVCMISIGITVQSKRQKITEYIQKPMYYDLQIQRASNDPFRRKESAMSLEGFDSSYKGSVFSS